MLLSLDGESRMDMKDCEEHQKIESLEANNITEEAKNEEGKIVVNHMEKEKICLLRAFVEKLDPSIKEVSDLTIRRFLRARNLDVDKASKMFLNYMKWRRTFVPNGLISPREISNEIEQNKMFLQGSDKKGRPIAVVLGARHIQNKIGGVDEFKRFLVYALDKLCTRTKGGQDKFVVIGDLDGWGYANSDIRGYLASLTILQEYYPERLGKLFFVHMPYIFMTAYKVVFPFIDEETRTKIVFVKDRKLKATLLQDIEEDQIPERYGGRLPLVPIHEG